MNRGTVHISVACAAAASLLASGPAILQAQQAMPPDTCNDPQYSFSHSRADPERATALARVAAAMVTLADSAWRLDGPATNWEGGRHQFLLSAAKTARAAWQWNAADDTIRSQLALLLWRAADLGEGHIDTTLAWEARFHVACLAARAHRRGNRATAARMDTTLTNIDYFLEEERRRSRSNKRLELPGARK